MDWHPHYYNQTFLLKYARASLFQLCELDLPQVTLHHHAKGPGGPLENKGRGFLIIFNSCHFGYLLEVRICLLVVNSWSLKSLSTNLYILRLLSCLMLFFSRSSETPVVQAWLCSVWLILPLCTPAVMLMQSEQAHHSPNITVEPIITVKNVLSATPHRDRVRKCFTLISQSLENPLQ